MSFAEQDFLHTLVEELSSAPASPVYIAVPDFFEDETDPSCLSTAAPSPAAYSPSEEMHELGGFFAENDIDSVLLSGAGNVCFNEEDLTPESSIFGDEDLDSSSRMTSVEPFFGTPLLVSESTATLDQQRLQMIQLEEKQQQLMRLQQQQYQPQQQRFHFAAHQHDEARDHFAASKPLVATPASLSKRGRKRKVSAIVLEQQEARKEEADDYDVDDDDEEYSGSSEFAADMPLYGYIDEGLMSSSSPSKVGRGRAGARKRVRSNPTADSEMKRNMHNVLERRRRDELKDSFNDLRYVVPELADNERAPKVVILEKATEYIGQLTDSTHLIRAEKDRALQLHQRLRARLQHLVLTRA